MMIFEPKELSSQDRSRAMTIEEGYEFLAKFFVIQLLWYKDDSRFIHESYYACVSAAQARLINNYGTYKDDSRYQRALEISALIFYFGQVREGSYEAKLKGLNSLRTLYKIKDKNIPDYGEAYSALLDEFTHNIDGTLGLLLASLSDEDRGNIAEDLLLYKQQLFLGGKSQNKLFDGSDGHLGSDASVSSDEKKPYQKNGGWKANLEKKATSIVGALGSFFTTPTSDSKGRDLLLPDDYTDRAAQLNFPK